MKLNEIGAVGIVTKQNATKDVPVGGEYMNVKKLGLGSGKPKLHDKKATKNTTPNKLFNLGITEDDDVLYHATYGAFVDSIMKNGLGGAGAQQQWEDSKPGYVYLARDPEVAESHAEANEEVPDEYIDDIVVFAIDTSKLDMDKLDDDPNIMDDDSTLAYKGVIPTSALMMAEGKRIPRKKGQKAGSKKHSDLYTDENPKGTIHGLKFATVKDAEASVNKIKRSGKKHAHKIQAAIAMEQRAKAAGKVSAAAVYRKYINAMKKKTKKMNELRIERPDPKDTLGIERKFMPQIKSDDYEEFIEYLTKNGVKFKQETIPASELKAMQNQFSDKGILKQLEKNIAQGPNTKAVIASSDDYILDGHHRWLVAVNTGTDLNVYRVNMPAWKLYDLVNQFQKVYYKDLYDEGKPTIGVPLSSGLTVSIFPHRPLRIKKSTPGKLRYNESFNLVIYDTALYEEWSAKYKKSINCSNPKGFSQRAHCAGRKKKKKSESINEEDSLGSQINFPGFDKKEKKKPKYKPIPKKDKSVLDKIKGFFTGESINEAYLLQLERGKNDLVLHVKDTKTGERMQVRGKPGYETSYDADDELHQLLDIIGKASNISELMNGEIVNVNPKHPDGPRSYSALDDLMSEAPTARDSMNLDADKLQQSIDYFYTTHAPKNFGAARTEGNFKGLKVVTFTKVNDTLMFLVDNQDQAVFYVMYSKFDNGVAIGNVRSNGTVKATEVYAYLVDKFGTLYSDDSQTPQGRKIWTSLAKFYPNLDVKDTGGRLVATKKTQVDEGVNDPHIFKAVFMAGGPGSGKSFVAKNILSGTGLRSIDSDEVYEYLMKKQGLSLDPETIFSPQGQEIRDKAKGLSRRREATYLDGRIGLIIDGTGKDVSKYQVMAQKLRAIGYDLSMIYVNTSLEVAQQRNKQRERSLEPAKVEQMWNEVQQNLMKFQQIFGAGRFHIIDNSGGLEDLDRQKNFDKVYNETQRFLNTPPSKRAALAWIQNQKAQNDEKRSANTPTTNYKSDGGTTATD